MSIYKCTPFNVRYTLSEDEYIYKLARHINVLPDKLSKIKLYSKSVDSRDKSDIKFCLSFTFFCENKCQPLNSTEYSLPRNVISSVAKLSSNTSPVIVGSGPSGLFCALYLAKAGLKPIVIERGSDLPQRSKDVHQFFADKVLNCESNIQFGLGGAGSFSDGKLTTGVKDSLIFSVFDTFYKYGADEEILYSSTPHIGTDKLINVVCNMRDEIIKNGGQFLFNTKVVDLLCSENQIEGVVVVNDSQMRSINANTVVLATGHSSRDMYYLLSDKGVKLSRKTFAMGVRIEHKRSLIDEGQYGKLAVANGLKSASYKLVSNGDSKVYTFCMCPGGEVVLSSSQKNTIVTNGMSNSKRDAEFSNSALLISIDPTELVGDDIFAGIKLQQEWEQDAFDAVGRYAIPAQNSIDFIDNKPSQQLKFTPSCQSGVEIVNIRKLLPKTFGDDIAQAIKFFGTKIKGFDTEGIILSPETRSSSPVRIDRDTKFCSSLKGLYPSGEGAGYAGGIVTSAVDGLKIAMQLVEDLR